MHPGTELRKLGKVPSAVADKVRKLGMAVPMVESALKPLATGKVDDWHGEYAYSLGLQAFIYGFPYIYNAQLRHKWVTEARDPRFTPYAAVNRFWHAPELIDASYRDGGCPNNDTLYSTSWLDLSEEPIVLSHPDMGDRYFAFEMMGVSSDCFGYVGTRATGSAAGSFAIVGPDWRGELPEGIDGSLARSPTPAALVMARTLVEGEADVAAVNALQKQFRLTPLSRWGSDAAEAPERRDVLEPIEPDADPLGPFKTLNAMLAENPPPRHHKLLLRQFAGIGIGPSLDPEQQPEAVRLGLIRAELVGMALLKQQFMSGDWATLINGWRYPPSTIGRFGDDFLLRAADQSLAGIMCNEPAEGVYLVNFVDGNGEKLRADRRYTLRFKADELPPVDAFWSLAMYGADLNLVANPIDRYSIGDKTDGLRRDPDGGVTILLQADPPEDDGGNWLPCPSSGDWFLILRLYLPSKSVIDGGWRCPPVRKVAALEGPGQP